MSEDKPIYTVTIICGQFSSFEEASNFATDITPTLLEGVVLQISDQLGWIERHVIPSPKKPTDNKEELAFLHEFISLLKKQDFILPNLQFDILSEVSKLLTENERIKQILEEDGVLDE